jgi:pimeloyl-ACP methyl ester carboxylesterase
MERRKFIAGVGAAAATAALCQSNPLSAQTTSGVGHRTADANGIHIHVAEQGDGPLVILCHGFPESWYSWRHQLAALSAAGFHAVAPDMRGYGRTDRPDAIEQYTMLHIVGDMVGLIDALGAEQAVIAGHDWGATVAWQAALLRPDRFRAVIALSVPFRPRAPVAPTSVMPRRDDAEFYQLYFQTPGVAETEFERDVRQTFIKTLFGASGDAPRDKPYGPWHIMDGGGSVGMVPRDGVLGPIPLPAALPPWLKEADVDFYVSEFKRTGFRGGLNWYRNINRNWELLAPFAGAKVAVPALYMAGDRDVVVAFQGSDQLIANMAKNVPLLRSKVMLPGCGHWTQQERASEVNAAMIDFLRQL